MPTHHPRRRQAGAKRTNVVLIVLLLLAGYAVAMFAPPYIRNWEVENVFDDEARRAHLVGDDEIRALILKKVRQIGFRDWGLADIGIQRDVQAGTISIWAQYDVGVTLVGGKVVTLHFAPAVDRVIERR